MKWNRVVHIGTKLNGQIDQVSKDADFVNYNINRNLNLEVV
jgi:hypothetical protein